jgi:hypothetical protein
MLAAILNGTIVAGRVVLLPRGRVARLMPWRALADFAGDPVGCRKIPNNNEGLCAALS